jgi:gluconokinase
VQLDEREPDAHGLTVLPLLGGERSPGWRIDARGAVAGLTFRTSSEDIAQAALESIAYRIAEIADAMPEVEEVVATGGALLADPAWIQVFADVLGRPVVASGVEEGSARGAAVIALERLGARPAPAPLGARFDPRPERHEAYRSARERQRDLYKRLR